MNACSSAVDIILQPPSYPRTLCPLFPCMMKTSPSMSLATILSVAVGVMSLVSAATAFVPPLAQLQQPLTSGVTAVPTPSALFITAEEQEDIFLERAMSASAQVKPDLVYIILFNPQTPMEAIHTLKFPRGANFEQSTSDVLLAFESFDDCVGFAQVLREDPAVDAGEPVPTPSSMQQIEQACAGMRLPIQVVPAAGQ